MTPIHAKVASTEKRGDEYCLIIDLVPSEFLGPFKDFDSRRILTVAPLAPLLLKIGLRLLTKIPVLRRARYFPFRELIKETLPYFLERLPLVFCYSRKQLKKFKNSIREAPSQG